MSPLGRGVQRRCKHNLQIVLVKRIDDSSDDPREIFDLDQRQVTPIEKRAAPGERSRDPVGGETQLAHSLKHTSRVARRNVWTPVEHT